MMNKKTNTPAAVTADEKLLRIQQVKDNLSAYDDKKIPLDPDEVEHIVDLLREWAALGDIWQSVDVQQREEQWANSVFPPLLRAARTELTRIAKWIEKNQESIIKRAHSARKSEARNRLETRISLLNAAASNEADCYTTAALTSVASGGGRPENIWAGIIIAAFAAKSDPGYLNELRIAELRGDLLMAIAELNRSMFLAIHPYAEKELSIGAKQAMAAKKGGKTRSIIDNEEAQKKRARELRQAHPEWKKTDVARQVAKDTGGAFNTIRKRSWLDEIMKSDLSIG